MRRLLIIFVVVAVVASFGVAVGENPGSGDSSANTKENAPCESGRGHPFENFTKQGRANDKCPPGDADDGQVDSEADAESDDDDREGTPPDPPQDLCTVADGDPGLLGSDPVAQQIWESDGSALSPLTEDPERDGAISGPLGDSFQPPDGRLAALEPVGNEAACLIDLMIVNSPPFIDL